MITPDELLRRFPFFAGLDDGTRRELQAASQVRAVRKGETLFHDGEPCKGLFIVQSGLVKIFKLSETGREQIVHVQRPGDGVAELPLFDNLPYPASAAAMEDSTVLFIPKVAFDTLLDQRPQLAHAVIAALSKRLRNMVALVENLSLRQVRQRLARLILEEAEGASTVHLAYTNDELAARLGSVRDVISRTLSALQADGVIHVRGRLVEIVDRRMLEDEAG